MNKNPLDLNRLTMDDIDFESVLPKISKEINQIEKECKEKYGNDWWRHFVKATSPHIDLDWDEETVNEAIYNGHLLCVSGDPVWAAKIENKYWDKMKRLFGPFYKRYVHHEHNDPKVNKALLKDALKSGKWRELPKELQKEYYKTAGK